MSYHREVGAACPHDQKVDSPSCVQNPDYVVDPCSQRCGYRWGVEPHGWRAHSRGWVDSHHEGANSHSCAYGLSHSCGLRENSCGSLVDSCYCGWIWVKANSCPSDLEITSFF